MTARLPSGSSLARAAACPASHVLPQSTTSSRAADDGTAIHAYLALVAMSPARKSEALARVPERLRARCAAVDLATIIHGVSGIVTEPAYAYDVVTGAVRYLGRDIGRAYGDLAPGEIACTLDVLGLAAGPEDEDGSRQGVAFLRDWKTGRDVGDPSDSWQLALQALVAREHFGEEVVDAGYVYLDDDGAHRVASVTWDALDLDMWAERVRDVVSRVRAVEASHAVDGAIWTSEGDHCAYCPAMPYCPAKTAYIAALVSSPGDPEAMAGAMSLDRVGAAWVALKAAGKWMDRAEAALKERIDAAGEVPLRNGKALRIVEVNGRSYVDTAAAKALLVELGATTGQIASVTKTAAPSRQVREGKPTPRALPAGLSDVPVGHPDSDVWPAGRM